MIGRTNVGGGGGGQTWSIRGWCATIGLSYAVLADIPESDMRQLMTKYASVAYFMEWYSNEPDMIDDFIANSYAMKWIGLRDYICDKLLALNSVKTKILASPQKEKIFCNLLPIMTSNTAPYGECFASHVESTTYDAWKAFDESQNDYCRVNQGYPQHIGYTFTTPACINRIWWDSNNQYRPSKVVIEASNDKNTWTALTDEIDITSLYGEVSFDNTNYYLSYRILIKAGTNSSTCYMYRIRMYGRSLNVSVPKMTSNTAPYGEITASGDCDTARKRLYAFDGLPSTSSSYGWLPASSDAFGSAYISYEFPNDVTFKGVAVLLSGGYSHAVTVRDMQFKIVGITSGGVSEDITDTLLVHQTETTYVYKVDNNKAYRTIRFVITGSLIAGNTPTTGGGYKLNFFGVDYSERTDRTYLYDHGLELAALDIFSNDARCTAEKANNYLKLNTSAVTSATTQTVDVVTNQTINLNQFNRMRCRIGDYFNAELNSAVFCVDETHNFVSGAVAYSILSTGGIDFSLDISSVASTLYCILCLHARATNGTFSVNEWWLE